MFTKFIARLVSLLAILDLEDDVKHVPDWLSGRHAIFVGTGSVDA